METLKVALISHEFPPFLIGGIGSHCYDLASSLSRNGVSVTVFCGGLDGSSVEKLNPHLEVVRLPFLNFSPKFLWFQLQNLRKLSNHLKDYDVVHGVHPLASALGSHLSKKMGTPFITTIHETVLVDLKTFAISPFSEWTFGDFTIHGLAYPLNDFLIKTCLKNSDHIVVCGFSTLEDLKKTHQNLNSEKISVIYNGVNFEKLASTSDAPADENPSIVFYGRLISRKGLTYLLKAMVLLKKDWPNLKLKIFGGGPLKPKITSMSRKLGLNNNVQVRGHVPYEELIAEIRKATVVALPSLYEVGPFISGLEAMALMKPLVAFDLPFTREFISDMDNGILAKAGDEEDLAEKIHLLLSNKDLRKNIGQDAYDYVRRNHDWDKLAQQYRNMYEDCISSR